MTKRTERRGGRNRLRSFCKTEFCFNNLDYAAKGIASESSKERYLLRCPRKLNAKDLKVTYLIVEFCQKIAANQNTRLLLTRLPAHRQSRQVRRMVHSDVQHRLGEIPGSIPLYRSVRLTQKHGELTGRTWSVAELYMRRRDIRWQWQVQGEKKLQQK